jgi:PiT family inorganic phosphate transporter
MAGVFNLCGGLTGTAVALTIGAGLVDPSALSLAAVVAAVAGAVTWSLFTYVLGIPVSQTHGLIGGMVGAAVATASLDVVQWRGLTKVLAPSSSRRAWALSAAPRPSCSPTGRSAAADRGG